MFFKNKLFLFLLVFISNTLCIQNLRAIDIVESEIKEDSISHISPENLEKVKAYIAKMEILLLKNEVSFSQGGITENDKYKNKMHQKLDALKVEVQKREKEIESQKKKNTYLLTGIGALFIFLIPLIIFIILTKNNKKSKKQNIVLGIKNKELKKAYSDITSSIKYANKIKSSIQVKKEVLTNYFEDAFIFNEFEDLISRNFYWFAKVNDKIVIVVGDSKADSVSGVLMNMMSVAFLDEIVKTNKETNPLLIIKLLNNRISSALNNNDQIQFNNGVNISIVTVNKAENKIQYVGANSTLHYIEDNKLFSLSSNLFAIGEKEDNSNYLLSELDIKSVNTIYLAVNGYKTTNDNKEELISFSSNLTRFFTRVINKPFQSQQESLQAEVSSWITKEIRKDFLCLGVLIN